MTSHRATYMSAHNQHSAVAEILPRVSSSLVTLARPSTSSSSCITDRSLWLCLTLSLESTPYFSPSTSSQSLYLSLACSCSDHILDHSVGSPLSPSITPSLFYSRIKTYLIHKSFPPQTSPTSCQDRFFGASRFLYYFSSLLCFFGSVRQIKVASRQLLGAQT